MPNRVALQLECLPVVQEVDGWRQSWTLARVIVFSCENFLSYIVCYRKYCHLGGISPCHPLNLPQAGDTLKYCLVALGLQESYGNIHQHGCSHYHSLKNAMVPLVCDDFISHILEILPAVFVASIHGNSRTRRCTPLFSLSNNCSDM